MNSHQPEWDELTRCTAFDRDQQIASGTLKQVATETKRHLDVHADRATILIFNDATAQQIEVDFRGTVSDVLSRLPKAAPSAETSATAEPPRGPGRPKLGVVGREVTLLPRHWAWLSEQPGGASVVLRRLVDAARLASTSADRKRRSQESAYRFMSVMAGDRPGFEEASRALFAGNLAQFEQHTAEWPVDIRTYLTQLARDAMTPER